MDHSNGDDTFVHAKTDRTLEVLVRDYYGKRTYYPACALSLRFAALLEQTTLTPHDVEQIKQLGYFFKIKLEEI